MNNKYTVMRFNAIDTRTRNVEHFRKEVHLDLSDPRDMFVIMQDIILESVRQGYERLTLESIDVFGEDEVPRW